MRYLKILGLAAVAATALMAFVGASTASAQEPEKAVLCKVTPTAGKCPMEPTDQMSPLGTEIKAQLVAGTTAQITPEGDNLPEDVCKKATLAAKTETTTTPTGNKTITLTECSLTTEVLESGSLAIHHDPSAITGLHNGQLTTSGGKIRIKALFGTLVCDYGGEIKDGSTITGGNPAKIDVTKTASLLAETGSFACPPAVIIHAEYEVTSPKPLYVGTH